MNKASLTEGFVTLKNLQKKPSRILLWNSPLQFHDLSEVTSRTELGDDVAVVSSVEGVDVPEHVRMLDFPKAFNLGLEHGPGSLILERL